MKKSKIIIPALGMLLLSTAASVTGTVAWFTSMQTGSASITSFSVTKTGGSLNTTFVAGVGTELTGSNPNYTGVALKGYGTGSDASDDVTLTHGSYNHLTNKAYIPDDSLTVFTPVVEPTSGNGYQWTVDGDSSNAGTVYYAVSWTINFNYTFSTDTKDVYLYFDGSTTAQSQTPAPTTTFSHSTNTAGSGSENTWKGFRLAMVNATDSVYVIWAPGTSTAGDEKYQSNAAAGDAKSSYAATNAYNVNGSLIDAAGYAHCKSGALPANPTQRADYLGTFDIDNDDNDDKVVTIAIKCVAWFEGNDSNVVDTASLDQVSASLGFYTRIATA